jgi:hypothetical protein
MHVQKRYLVHRISESRLRKQQKKQDETAMDVRITRKVRKLSRKQSFLAMVVTE